MGKHEARRLGVQIVELISAGFDIASATVALCTDGWKASLLDVFVESGGEKSGPERSSIFSDQPFKRGDCRRALCLVQVLDRHDAGPHAGYFPRGTEQSGSECLSALFLQQVGNLCGGDEREICLGPSTCLASSKKTERVLTKQSTELRKHTLQIPSSISCRPTASPAMAVDKNKWVP